MVPTTSLALLAGTISSVTAIWPWPKEISTGNKFLMLDDSVKVTYNGEILSWSDFTQSNDSTFFNSKDIVTGAVSRAMQTVLNKNWVPYMLRARNAIAESEPDLHNEPDKVKNIIIQQTKEDSNSTWKPTVGEIDEAYTLDLALNGTATITACSSIGIQRALQTFIQLFYSHSTNARKIYTPMAPVTIEDCPEYDYRGILVDVGRSYIDKDHLLRTIDAMAFNKLNVFHLHLTDSQAWPLEVPSMPDLANKGRYAPGMTYSIKDIQDIQRYGIQRAVNVIIEIDMPAHIGSVALSRPELIVAWNHDNWSTYCAEPPCGQFKLNDTKVETFLDDLMDDILPEFATYSAYFHSGGDELNLNVYKLQDDLKTNDSDVLYPLIRDFGVKNHERISNHGLKSLVWEEMINDYGVDYSDKNNVIVQEWLGHESLKNLTDLGYKVIDSDYNAWYLDCGRGVYINANNGADFAAHYPFNDWCSPTKNWRLAYSHNPRAGLSDEKAKLVVGGEVALWSETVQGSVLDSLLWPRASAAGEVLWSGATDQAGHNRTQSGAAPRIAEMNARLMNMGYSCGGNDMMYCLQPGNKCNWSA